MTNIKAGDLVRPRADGWWGQFVDWRATVVDMHAAGKYMDVRWTVAPNKPKLVGMIQTSMLTERFELVPDYARTGHVVSASNLAVEPRSCPRCDGGGIINGTFLPASPCPDCHGSGRRVA